MSPTSNNVFFLWEGIVESFTDSSKIYLDNVTFYVYFLRVSFHPIRL